MPLPNLVPNFDAITQAGIETIGKIAKVWKTVFAQNISDGTATHVVADLLTATSVVGLRRTVFNDTGTSIAKGSVVAVSGAAQGSDPRVVLADADSLSTARAIGITIAQIANGSTGQIVTSGEIGGMNTSGFSVEGAALFLSSTAGVLTETAESSPSFSVPVAYVLRKHANDGRLLVVLEMPRLGFGISNQVRGMTAAGTAEEYKTIEAGAGISVTHAVGEIKVAHDSTYAEDEGESTTTNSAFQTKLTSTMTLAAGDYIVSWSAETASNDTIGTGRVQAEMRVDAAQIGFQDHSSDTNQAYESFSGMRRMTLAAGSRTFDIRFNSQSGTARIRRARILVSGTA